MKTKLLMIATGAIALFGLCSCFQIESTISVKKDGSGTITEVMLLGEQMKAMMEMAAAQGGQNGQNPMADMLDKGKAEAHAKQLGEGVELVSIEKIDANGKVGVKTVYKFADINKLNYTMNMGDTPGAAKKEKAKDSGLTFKLVDGHLTIIQKAPKAPGEKADDDAADDEQPDMDPQMLAMMQGMMKDMRITTKVVIESGISKTDATYVEGKVITLADIKMGKLLSDPEKLKALQGGDFDKTKEALKGIDGIKFEGKESVSVEMK